MTTKATWRWTFTINAWKDSKKHQICISNFGWTTTQKFWSKLHQEESKAIVLNKRRNLNLMKEAIQMIKSFKIRKWWIKEKDVFTKSIISFQIQRSPSWRNNAISVSVAPNWVKRSKTKLTSTKSMNMMKMNQKSSSSLIRLMMKFMIAKASRWTRITSSSGTTARYGNSIAILKSCRR